MKTTSSHNLCLLAILLAVLQSAIPARATVVTTNTQAALAAALAGGGTVTFAFDGTITLSSTLAISSDVIVDGSGHNIAISGSNAVQIFLVNPSVTFTLKNLALINGSLTTTGPDSLAGGAALYNAGTLNAINCVFSNNAVLGTNTGTFATSAAGGAIFNQAGTMNVTNCTFLTNTVTGGPHYGPNLNQPTYVGDGLGGAICSLGGLVNLNGDIFYTNSASGGSDAGIGSGAAGTLGSGFGGALYSSNGVTLVTACRFTNNCALGSVGQSSGSSENGGAAVGGAICQLGGSLTMTQTDLATNSATGGAIAWYYGYGGSGFGGGLFNSGTMNVTDCTFSGNNATGAGRGTPPGDGDGGGLYNMGTASLAGVTMAGNYVVSGQAGESGNAQAGPSGTANGGGIYNSNTLVLLGSTLVSNLSIGTPGYLHNQATIGTAVGASVSGGGIYNQGTLWATNNTLYGNSSTGGLGVGAAGGNAYGGGFFNNGGNATLAFQTIFGNMANGGQDEAPGPSGLGFGGGILATNGTVTLYNSIVASNASGGDFYVLSNAVTDGGNSLSSDASFAFTAPGSHNNVNPLLGPLTNNGGPTLTMLPLTGSPAIDAASAVSTTPFDQRGLARPFGSASDIGAVEHFPYYPSVSIQGIVQHAPVNQPVTVTAGIYATTTDPSGNYTLSGIPAGSYSVTPAASGFVFVPPSQSVSLSANANNVNFAAYQSNALTIESYISPVLRIAYAGTSGQSAVVQSSATLSNWTPLLTNTAGTNGIFEFQVTNTPGQPVRFYRAHSP